MSLDSMMFWAAGFGVPSTFLGWIGKSIIVLREQRGQRWRASVGLEELGRWLVGTPQLWAR